MSTNLGFHKSVSLCILEGGASPEARRIRGPSGPKNAARTASRSPPFSNLRRKDLRIGSATFRGTGFILRICPVTDCTLANSTNRPLTRANSRNLSLCPLTRSLPLVSPLRGQPSVALPPACPGARLCSLWSIPMPTAHRSQPSLSAIDLNHSGEEAVTFKFHCSRAGE